MRSIGCMKGREFSSTNGRCACARHVGVPGPSRLSDISCTLLYGSKIGFTQNPFGCTRSFLLAE